MKRTAVLLLCLLSIPAMAKTFGEAIQEAMDGKYTCILNSDLAQAKATILWQAARIAELESQLAAKK